MLRDQPPIVYGDGEQTRDFTHIDNVVEANMLAARADKAAGQVLNVACGESVTINQVILIINKLLDKNISAKYEPTRAGDVKHSLADISLAREVIGFEPKIMFEQGLGNAIDWYKENL